MKKYLILFFLFLNFSSFAADQQPIYEREEVSTTAKMSSVFWTVTGALTMSTLSVWKAAPIHQNMSAYDYGATAAITSVSLFSGSFIGAYGGKILGHYIDPIVQYYRARNWIVKKLTSGINYVWNVSSFYSMHALYKWDDIRQSHLQGTLFELKDPK